eukprot:365427-Chlamydomonas_euryale.AAC.6
MNGKSSTHGKAQDGERTVGVDEHRKRAHACMHALTHARLRACARALAHVLCALAGVHKQATANSCECSHPCVFACKHLHVGA